MIDAMSSSLFLEIISVKRASSFLYTQKINEKKIHNNFRSINRMNYSQNCWKLNYVHTCNMKLYQNPENYRSGPISLDPAQYFPILPDVIRSCSILPDPARYYPIPPDITRSCSILPEFFRTDPKFEISKSRAKLHTLDTLFISAIYLKIIYIQYAVYNRAYWFYYNYYIL